MEGEAKVEEINGGYAGDENGERGGEAFEYVVGVFDDQGDDESSGGLEENERADEGVVTEEEASSAEMRSVVEKAGAETKGHGEDAELDVSHPERDVGGGLEYPLEVNAGETGEEAGAESGGETEELVLLARRCGATNAALRQLDENDAEDQEEESAPLKGAERLAEESDGEESCRQNFQLIGDLKIFGRCPLKGARGRERGSDIGGGRLT